MYQLRWLILLVLCVPKVVTAKPGLYLNVRPFVDGITLHTYQGLAVHTQPAFPGGAKDTMKAITLPVASGMILISFPDGPSFPLLVTPGDTEIHMILSAGMPEPQISGSPASVRLYDALALFAGIGRRRAALDMAIEGTGSNDVLTSIIRREQTRLTAEDDSLRLYWSNRLHDPAIGLLWGNNILPSITANLVATGKAGMARDTMLAYLAQQYTLATQTDLMIALLQQYLLVSEVEPFSPGLASYESRIRKDVDRLAIALKEHYTHEAVTNHIIQHFSNRNMWTLCDSLMKDNPAALCPVPGLDSPSTAQIANLKSSIWHRGGDDSLQSLQNKSLIVAVFDASCPAARMEFILLRRQFTEGFKPGPGFAVAMPGVRESDFGNLWQGMPGDIWYATDRNAYSAIQTLQNVPSYWLVQPGKKARYLGRSYRNVLSVVNDTEKLN